jgi:hypothetical protein
MFSRSKEKRNSNKRCTTEPEGEELLASSNKKNEDSLRFSND